MSAFQTSGKRKALLIGINYVGMRNELKGCVHDTVLFYELLVSRFGFKSEDFVILTDVNTGINGVCTGSPTRKMILNALQSLVEESQGGDSLFFLFSGHGGQVWDHDGDESDGWDETILPLDYKTAGYIADDELHAIVTRLSKGAKLTAVLDSCHSGTGMDLPYQYKVSERGIELQVHDSGKDPAFAQVLSGMASRFMAGDDKSVVAAGKYLLTGRGREKRKSLSPPDPEAGQVLLFSGCKDQQLSKDLRNAPNGSAAGALTYALVQILQNLEEPATGPCSYASVVRTLREKLLEYSMTPQFSTSHPFNINTNFNL